MANCSGPSAIATSACFDNAYEFKGQALDVESRTIASPRRSHLPLLAGRRADGSSLREITQQPRPHLCPRHAAHRTRVCSSTPSVQLVGPRCLPVGVSRILHAVDQQGREGEPVPWIQGQGHVGQRMEVNTHSEIVALRVWSSERSEPEDRLAAPQESRDPCGPLLAQSQRSRDCSSPDNSLSNVGAASSFTTTRCPSS